MLVLGLVLLLVGLFTTMHVLFVVGLVVLIAGIVMNFAPGPWVGSGSGRRRYW